MSRLNVLTVVLFMLAASTSSAQIEVEKVVDTSDALPGSGTNYPERELYPQPHLSDDGTVFFLRDSFTRFPYQGWTGVYSKRSGEASRLLIDTTTNFSSPILSQSRISSLRSSAGSFTPSWGSFRMRSTLNQTLLFESEITPNIGNGGRALVALRSGQAPRVLSPNQIQTPIGIRNQYRGSFSDPEWEPLFAASGISFLLQASPTTTTDGSLDLYYDSIANVSELVAGYWSAIYSTGGAILSRTSVDGRSVVGSRSESVNGLTFPRILGNVPGTHTFRELRFAAVDFGALVSSYNSYSFRLEGYGDPWLNSSAVTSDGTFVADGRIFSSINDGLWKSLLLRSHLPSQIDPVDPYWVDAHAEVLTYEGKPVAGLNSYAVRNLGSFFSAVYTVDSTGATMYIAPIGQPGDISNPPAHFAIFLAPRGAPEQRIASTLESVPGLSPSIRISVDERLANLPSGVQPATGPTRMLGASANASGSLAFIVKLSSFRPNGEADQAILLWRARERRLEVVAKTGDALGAGGEVIQSFSLAARPIDDRTLQVVKDFSPLVLNDNEQLLFVPATEASGATPRYLGFRDQSGGLTYLDVQQAPFNSLLAPLDEYHPVSFRPETTLRKAAFNNDGEFLFMLRDGLRSVLAKAHVIGHGSCRADFNADGTSTIQDIFDFLAAWLNTTPGAPNLAADFDHNGLVSQDDLFGFLNAWFTGCG